jgi:hypothetical protein
MAPLIEALTHCTTSTEVVQRTGDELARHIICAFHPETNLELDTADREEDH